MGALHTPLDHTQQKRTIIWGFMGYAFIPCGMFVGRMQYAPTTVRAFDGWVVRVFSRRGVLHTPLYHTQRKRTIIWGFMGYTIIPCGMIVGRMQYAPTTVREFYRWVVRVFSRRCVLHTPQNVSGFWFNGLRVFKKWMENRFIRPLTGPFVGRMQYAPKPVPRKWVVMGRSF